MKKRSVAKIILLSLVTLGIYQLFWLKWTSDEMRAMHIKVPALKWLVLPMVAYIVLVMAGAIGLFTLTDGQPGDSPTGLLGLVFVFAIIFLAILQWIAQTVWYWYFSKSVEQVTRGQMTASTSLLLIIILTFFGVQFAWPGIVQDAFNKVGPVQPQKTPTPPATS